MMNLKEMVIKNNPRVDFIEFDEIDGLLVAKIGTSKVSWKAVEKVDFYYNAYFYLKDVNRVKILDFLGFSYKKGGIVGISTRGLPEQRDKNYAVNALRDAIKKFNDLLEKLDENQIIRTVDEYYKVIK